MQAMGVVLCILLVTARLLAVLGLEYSLSDDPGNQLDSDSFEQGGGGVEKFDEYPVIVPKRAALLLDRIMVALQKALEDDKNLPSKVPSVRSQQPPPLLPLPRISARDELDNRNAYVYRMNNNLMALQRRGQTTTPKGSVWKCSFNVVTCFRKK